MKYAKNTVITSVSICAIALLSSLAAAQPQIPSKMMQLGIVNIGSVKSVRTAAVKAEQGDLLDRFIESLDQQLLDAFHNTRKFAVIARGDLGTILEEHARVTGRLVDANDPKAAQLGKIKGVDYLLTATIDDFTNASSGTYVEGMGMTVSRRNARVSVVFKIYNSTTGHLLQSVAIPVMREEKGTSRVTPGDYTTTPKAINDSIIVALANEVAVRAAARVVDIVFPAKVIGNAAGTITISRGEGAGISRDELWEVFALGQEMKDPDTGEVLGREEVKVGEIAITDVLPKFSKARLIGDDRGIDIGAIVRPKMAPPVAPQ